MKDIIKITISLTAVCLVSAIILGAVFAKTDHARKEVAEGIEREAIQDLLGFGHGKKAPDDLKVYAVYRYILNDPSGATLLGYLLPVKDKGYVLAEVDLSGKPLKVIQVVADASKLADQSARDTIVRDALPKGYKAVYADTVNIANLGAKRLGYVVKGKTQGFKEPIELMVSLDPDFTLTGVAVLESKEDPGLGDGIKKDYFRNQFVGKTQDLLKNLRVVKEPLPDDYLSVLEPEKAKNMGLSAEKVKEIKEKHLKDDIYALTGATISSRALLNGVKDTARKFVYRLGIVTDAVKQQNIQVAF
jgi:Na+-translocating ferredoxin:NAD+ oxidoreductase subunit G